MVCGVWCVVYGVWWVSRVLERISPHQSLLHLFSQIHTPLGAIHSHNSLPYKYMLPTIHSLTSLLSTHYQQTTFSPPYHAHTLPTSPLTKVFPRMCYYQQYTHIHLYCTHMCYQQFTHCLIRHTTNTPTCYQIIHLHSLLHTHATNKPPTHLTAYITLSTIHLHTLLHIHMLTTI